MENTQLRDQNLVSYIVNINLADSENLQSDGLEFIVEDSNHEEAPKKKINLRPVIEKILYATAFLIPLFFLPWTSEFLEFNKQSLLIIAAGAGLILFLIEAIQNGAVAVKTSRLYLPMAGIAVAAILASVFSGDIYQSLLGAGEGVRAFSLASVLALVVIFFLALNVIEDEGKVLKKLIAGSLGLTFLISIIQIFGIFLIGKPPYNTFGFNTVGSLNALALIGALMLPLFLETKFKVFKAVDVAKVAGILALFMMILVNWWVVWVAGFVALISWMGFKTLETGRINVRTYIVPMVVVVIGAMLMLINFSMPILKARLPVEVSPNYKSSVNIALSSLKEKPIFGYGLGQYGLAYDQYKPVSISQTIFASTHFTQSASSGLTLAVEGGIVMILAILFLIAMVLLELYQFRRADGFLALGMLVFFLLFSYNMTLLFFFFIALALLELKSQNVERKEFIFDHSPKYSLFGSLAFILGLLLVLAGTYFVTLRYVADAYYVKAIQSGDPDTVISNFTKAINIIPQDTNYYRLMSQAIIIKLNNDINNKDDKTPPQDRLQRLRNLATSAIDIAKRASDIDPDNAQNWVNRGLIYQNLIGLVGGSDQAAVNMYNEAIKRMPNDPTVYNSIGSIYLTIAENSRLLISNPPKDQPNLNLDAIRKQVTDNFTKAEESYNKAIELNNNYGQALFALGVVYEREGKLGESIKQFEKLRVGNPNDPSIAFQLGLLYYRNNQKDQAFAQLQQATILFPNYSNARWYLSLLYEERGDLVNALTQVLEIEKSNHDNSLVQERITQLQNGQRLIPPQKVLDQKPL